MILKHKPVNSTEETEIYSKAGGKVGIAEIIERWYITKNISRLILRCLDFYILVTE